MHLWFRRGGAFVGVERNLLVAEWRGPPDVAQLAALVDAASAVGARHAEGGGLLSVVAEVRGAPPVTLDARTLGPLALPSTAHRGAAHVVLPRGLVGLGVRSVLTAIGAMGARQGPSETFDALEPAAEWLARRLSTPGQPWTAAEILASYAGARTLIDPGDGRDGQ